jgi:multidrug efflux pump subunit AcrA (membrane-fusion protein)
VQIPNPEEDRPLPAGGTARDRPLKPGMYGHAALSTGIHPKSLVLPVDAVVTEEEARSVFVVDGGKARRVPVEIGFDGGDWLEIVHGLQGDEQVIVQGIDLVSDGAPVSVAGGEKPRERTEPLKKDADAADKRRPSGERG